MPSLLCSDPEHEELFRRQRERIAELERKLRTSEREKRKLEKENKELKDQVKSPPWVQPSVHARSTPKKRGAPAWHEGTSRRTPAVVDRSITISLTHCPDCGGKVGAAGAVPDSRTQTEVPTVQPLVTRFVATRHWCGRCRKKVSADLDRVTTAGRFGPNVHAHVAFLKTRHMSDRAIRSYFRQAYRLSVSPAAIWAVIQRVGAALGPWERGVEQELRDAEVVNIDETGARLLGRNGWLWTFTTGAFTLLKFHLSRAGKVPRQQLGPDFDGLVGHDGFTAYNRPLGKVQQYCIVHLNRSVQRGEKHYGIEPRTLLTTDEAVFTRAGRPRKPFIAWADALRALLQDSIDYSTQPHGPRARTAKRRGLDRRLKALLVATPADRESRRIAKEIRKNPHKMFTFVQYPQIEYHNNSAERSLRNSVIDDKVRGGSRSLGGAHNHFRPHSADQTCRQNRWSLFDFVTQALMGRLPKGLAEN